jgi:antirestriction protein ArdC
MTKIDIYEQITNQIVELLEEVDPSDYRAPFATLADFGLPFNATTEANYSGINIPALWLAQHNRGYTTPRWATFKQWKAMGGNVKKGERGTSIVFYKQLKKTETNENGDEEKRVIPMLKTFTVFNADQVEGIEQSEIEQKDRVDLVSANEMIDDYVTQTGAVIETGTKAAYFLTLDKITMPQTNAFVDTKFSSASDAYYSTLFHELTHWTGAKNRLDREGITGNQTKSNYAFEELIAELGAAFLSAKFGIQQSGREDHALYIQSWLKALKNDKKFVFKAAAAASAAAEYIDQLQGEAGLKECA